MSKKSLSLIVATYNRSPQILRCLGSIVAQSADPSLWEVVVVDNNSTDDTESVVSDFIVRHSQFDIRLAKEIKQGLSHARNCGIAASTGDIVAIIDDDETVVEEYINIYIDFFASHPDVGSAGGAVIPIYESCRPEWMSHLCEVPIANPIRQSGVPRPFAEGKIPGGGNMAVRRSALERYGLFDTTLGRSGTKLLGGEESNLFARLRVGGEQIWFVPDAAIYHFIADEKLTRDYLDRLWYNIGVSQSLRARIEGVSRPLLLLREAAKWGVTLVLAIYYLFTLRPKRGWYLTLMRYFISRGICSK